jgi:hypothetical protein
MEIMSFCCKGHFKLYFQIIKFTIISEKQATTPNHCNFFNFTLTLSEGREGEA